LETLIWDKIKAVISDPEIILVELKKQAEAVKLQTDITWLDKEIRTIERQLKEYPAQEKRLINALKTGQFTQDYILDELNRNKATREAFLPDDRNLNKLKLTLLISKRPK
jgi:site-specific DNA recombinase